MVRAIQDDWNLFAWLASYILFSLWINNSEKFRRASENSTVRKRNNANSGNTSLPSTSRSFELASTERTLHIMALFMALLLPNCTAITELNRYHRTKPLLPNWTYITDMQCYYRTERILPICNAIAELQSYYRTERILPICNAITEVQRYYQTEPILPNCTVIAEMRHHLCNVTTSFCVCGLISLLFLS